MTAARAGRYTTGISGDHAWTWIERVVGALAEDES